MDFVLDWLAGAAVMFVVCLVILAIVAIVIRSLMYAWDNFGTVAAFVVLAFWVSLAMGFLYARDIATGNFVPSKPKAEAEP